MYVRGEWDKVEANVENLILLYLTQKYKTVNTKFYYIQMSALYFPYLIINKKINMQSIVSRMVSQ